MSRLFLASTGPGDPNMLTPDARAAIDCSTDIVGYQLYIDLLGNLADGKTHHQSRLGNERERAALALDLAASGKTTALVSSGDIGIYAMAAVVFQLLDEDSPPRGGSGAWSHVDIEVVPGVSAMQAASSRVGAMLGHDFCTISLSDLLTPWDLIERRIHSAGKGDFVVSFYNPVSKKRDWHLNSARDILLNYRPDSTPVVIARNVGRQDEAVRITSLADLDAGSVDMFTLVCVGSSTTRRIDGGRRNWVYTPRGYGGKPA